MRRTRRDWVLVALAVVVASVCVRLGIWQLARLGERRARNAAAAEQRVRAPLELTASVDPDSISGRLVQLRGRYDYAHERVWPARPFDGVPGVAVLTPLQLDGRVAVFVDRGWVPSADGLHVDHGALRGPDSADFVGLAWAAPRGRGDIDPSQRGDSLPYRVLPIVVQRLPVHLAPAANEPRAWPLPELSNGPHLSYAIQWFSFATITLVGTLVLLRKTRRAEGPAPPGAAPRG
jgi:surfeit locus 1 family protein